MLAPINPAVDRRARWLLRLLMIWGVAVLARLFYLQIVKHDYYADLAEQQQTRLVEIAAHRGTIYDRNGHILAITVPVETVVVNPQQVPNTEVAASIFSEILGLNEKELLGKLDAKVAEKRKYFKIAEQISQEQAKRLKSLRLGWIQFESSTIRVYPNDQLAAHILGGVDFEKAGNGGIEQGLEDELAGRPGYAHMVTDVRHRGLESVVEIEPIPGNDVTLTIDYRVQFELEKLLGAAVIANNCWTGRALVMDPHNGEIVAMASYPTYNPNDKVVNMEARQNLPIQSPIEPGSVFKVFTIAGAIQDRKVTPKTGFHCGNGILNLFGRVIHDHDPYGYIPVEDILAHSSNIGAIRVAQELGEKRFSEYIKAFGFGSKTGLPLPGESSGRVLRLSKWTKSSIGSVAMGHEVMATTIQLGQAASVIANGGQLIPPKIVRRITAASSEGPNANRVPLRRTSFDEPQAKMTTVLSPDAVVQMRKMMEHVVLGGTGRKAKIAGYSVGGKTGSAQIYDVKAKQYSHKYHATFMGFTPVNDPRLVTIITLDGSTKYGGAVSAPVFSEATNAALRILNVPRDLPDDIKSEPVKDISINDAPDTETLVEKSVEEVENSDETVTKSTFVTPSFAGMTLRAALEAASKAGFRIDPIGSGLVREQSPPAGEPVSYGQKIKLRFGR
ncbi:penicillin-binding protein [Bryobacter aggregatus]|uniref:penicillin-binding protein n=1 Tax=Bryobacter aggregatus TaxID=360054 RepID=UPI0004E0B1FD|nr:penicillin-binding protein [Bryobacter aggregatus]